MRLKARPQPLTGRRSADERREEVLRAAVEEFAVNGLHGTSTEAIARRTGISQPYVFRLFPTKKDLFLAAVDQCFGRVEAAFQTAARKAADLPAKERLHEMGHAYLRLISHRELLLFQMQAYAACADEEIRGLVQARWLRLRKLVGELSGAQHQAVTDFFAKGMLLNIAACVGTIPGREVDQWAHDILGFA